MTSYQKIADEVITLIEEKGETIRDFGKQVFLGIGAFSRHDVSGIIAAFNAAAFDAQAIIAAIKTEFALA